MLDGLTGTFKGISRRKSSMSRGLGKEHELAHQSNDFMDIITQEGAEFKR